MSHLREKLEPFGEGRVENDDEEDYADVPLLVKCGSYKIPAAAAIYPALFLFCVVMFGSSISYRYGLQSVICYHIRNGSPLDASGSNHTGHVGVPCDKDKDVIAETTKWNGIMLTTLGFASCITSGTIASYTDVLGRRVVLALAAFGQALNALAVYLCVLFNLHPSWCLIGAVFNGLSGGYPGFLACSFAYAADLTPERHRSIVFGVAESMLYLGGALGPLLIGFLQQTYGSQTTLLSLIILASALVVYVFFMPASRSFARLSRDAKRTISGSARSSRNSSFSNYNTMVQGSEDDVSEKLSCTELFWQFNLLTVLWALVKRPLPVVLIVTSFMLYFCSLLGNAVISGSYAQLQFDWQSEQQGVYASITGVVRAAGVWFFNYLFFKGPRWARMEELHVMILSAFAFGGMYLAQAFVASPFAFFCIGMLNVLGGLMMPLVRSMVSKSFDSSKQGVALTSIAAVEAITTLWVPVVLGALFQYSVKTMHFPQLYLYILSGLSFIAMLLLLTINRTKLTDALSQSQYRGVDESSAI
jgi:MFS family permease|eukprot:g2962.t1